MRDVGVDVHVMPCCHDPQSVLTGHLASRGHVHNKVVPLAACSSDLLDLLLLMGRWCWSGSDGSMSM